eukprot:SAG31_NODE_13871_length_841_cov_0.942049_1_plen_72_part_00
MYMCQCAFGWYGDNCETSEDDCSMPPLDKCADQPGTSCVDCARGHYEGYQYVPNPECEYGFTCEGSSSGVG